MLKRRGSGVVLKRHRSILLPEDVVELILERLPVKSLLRFKCVSSKWKSRIESRCFKAGQLIRSRGPEVIYVTWSSSIEEKKTRSVLLGLSKIRVVKFPFSNTMVCHGSCDGLICLFCINRPNIVLNPATRWHQSFPLSKLQKRLSIMYEWGKYHTPCHHLGFGKDKFRGTYKPVLLCNSSEYRLDNATTCEVFDFSTNAWRYVLPASPYRIIHNQKPVYFDGSLYWLTECEETKVISFDLHTETFQVICNAPFLHVPDPCCLNVLLCILDNRLCVSQKNWPTTQLIWSLGGNKTWNLLCSIDLTNVFYFPDCSSSPFPIVLPLAILDKKKLLLGRDIAQPLVIHDLHTKSYDIVLIPEHNGYPLCYFESLFSASSN